jgi:translation initiation factor eIF-2B subunit gamma
MSADLIVQEGFIHQLADIHRTRDAAVTVLLKKQPKPEQPVAKKDKTESEPADFIGINDQGRLLFFSSAADLEEQLTLTKSLLGKYCITHINILPV